MNGKQAKALRRIASRLTVGQPQTAYTVYTAPVYQVIKDNLGVIVSIKRTVAGVPRKLIKDCTRSMIHLLRDAGAHQGSQPWCKAAKSS